MDWKSFFDRLGLNGTWWQWRIYRLQERWSSWRQGAGDARRVIAYEHGFCRNCGAIVPRGEAKCLRCGAAAPSRAAEVTRRTLGLVLPGWCPATTLLLGANHFMMALPLALYGWQHLLQPQSAALLRLGALDPSLALAGEPHRLVTYGFLHIGLMHILFNMLALSQVGPVLEREIGSVRFFVVYLLSLIGGGLADLIVRGPVAMIIAGASGALFGLIGLGLSYAHFYGGPAGRAQRNFFLQWALYGFVFGFIIRADNICHLGGFITGVAAGFLIERERRAGRAFDPAWNTLAGLGVVAILAAFARLAWN